MTENIRPPTIPIKRVQGDTLRERLTENVYDRILPARYLRRNEEGTVIETPEELFRRVADAIAAAETEYGNDQDEWSDRFYEMMTSLEFMPNSPTLMNAGTPIPQHAACFVLSPEDSLLSIFETLQQAALVMQSGGGVGYSFSKLRPRGDLVGSTGGTASGPVSFMRIFDTMCEEIRQGGRRRGAQMGILRVDHPDIGRFCTEKRAEGPLSNFNVSVGITDEFVEAVRTDDRYPLMNPRTDEQHVVSEATASFYSRSFEDAPPSVVEANLWRDHADSIEGLEAYRGSTDLEEGDPMTLPAGFVWQLIVDGAWLNGEPGLFMLDETNRDHSFDVDRHPEHRIEATNPCGEQGLESFEACNLGHVNLSLMAAEDLEPWFSFRDDEVTPLEEEVRAFLEQAIDWERMSNVVRDGTRFLDDVITVSDYPIDEIERTVGRLRKIGLGLMGLAELLIQLGVRYGTPASFEVARQLMAYLTNVSKRTSYELAKERGSFPDWADSKYATPIEYAEWFEQHTGLRAADWPDGLPLRNHSTTTIAPTGTTGMIANTSGGCEPLFNVIYFKNVGRDVQGEEMLVEFDEYFRQTLEANGLDPQSVREEAIDLLQSGEFSGPADLSIPTELAGMFVTAREVAGEDHVRMQAALQAHVDSAISKTINFASDATSDDIAAALDLAIELGCKGLTVYRDRSREEQVLTTRPDSDVDAGGRPVEARCCPVWV